LYGRPETLRFTGKPAPMKTLARCKREFARDGSTIGDGEHWPMFLRQLRAVIDCAIPIALTIAVAVGAHVQFRD
jgi:hypothetical protein